MQHTLLPNILLSCLILCLLTSCNDNTKNDPFSTTTLHTISEDNIGHSTRAFVEYGQEEITVSFTVIYTGDLLKMTTDNNSAFKILLNTYNLEIQRQFKLDEENKGIVLAPVIPLVAPVEVGKEISLINEVLMVEVQNVSKEEKDPT